MSSKPGGKALEAKDPQAATKLSQRYLSAVEHDKVDPRLSDCAADRTGIRGQLRYAYTRRPVTPATPKRPRPRKATAPVGSEAHHGR